MKGSWLLLIFCLFGPMLLAQQHPLANWRKKQIALKADTLLLDSLPIIPQSLVLTDPANGKKIPNYFFKINYNQLIVQDSLSPADQATLKGFFDKKALLEIQYRVFPYDLQQPVRHLDTLLIAKDYEGDYIGFDYTPNKNSNNAPNLFSNRGLQYSGSFARGLSFGNSQNLVLNSRFNLQLSGKLGEDTEILAALTDENIPLQAEGNTQQLQEFDKIFIQIKRKSARLVAGDYDLINRDAYFMKYFKRLQGATFSTERAVFKKGLLETKGSFAISSGQFARNTIPPQEGNQGPYKLQGNGGEQFIIVLAGTERVYLDGQLMRRGIEEDYIIDYNRGELSFTNKRLIIQKYPNHCRVRIYGSNLSALDLRHRHPL